MIQLSVLFTRKTSIWEGVAAAASDGSSLLTASSALLIYTAQGSPFRRKKLSVINGSPEQQRTKTTLNI